MGVCGRCYQSGCPATNRVSARVTYSKGALQGDLVPLDALDGGIGDGGLAILEDRGDIDGLPGDGGLDHTGQCLVRAGASALRRLDCELTLAAAKMSLTASEISGPMPSPSIKLTAKLPYIHPC